MKEIVKEDIPTCYAFMLPLLKFLSDDRTAHNNEVVDYFLEYFNFSKQYLKIYCQSGKSMFKDRIGMAKYYLKRHGLIECPKNRYTAITDLGKDLLNLNLEYVDQLFLIKNYPLISKNEPEKNLPSYDDVIEHFLKFSADGKTYNIKEVSEYLKNIYKVFFKDDKKMLLLLDKYIPKRTVWARYFLKKHRIIQFPKIGHFKITDAGKDLLSKNLKKINKNYIRENYSDQDILMHIKRNKKSRHPTQVALNIADKVPKKYKVQLQNMANDFWYKAPEQFSDCFQTLSDFCNMLLLDKNWKLEMVSFLINQPKEKIKHTIKGKE